MLITAEQARQRVSEYEASQFNKIMESIDRESTQGFLKYYGEGELRLTTKKKLEELGYKVMINNRESEYCISWE